MKTLLVIFVMLLPSLVFGQTVDYTFTLTWQDNSNNEDGFYIYRQGQRIAAVGKDVQTYKDPVSGAVVGQQFCYEVSAFNSAGESAKASACGKVPSPPTLPVPNPPSGLTTAATAQTTIQTSWDVNNPEGTVSIVLTRQRLAPPELQTIKLGVDAQTYVETNLPRRQTYCYQARAENAAGVSPVSNQSCASTR